MAVIHEYPWKDDNGVFHDDLIKHYSDLNFKIQKVGTDAIYESAVDPYPTDREYIETNIPIDKQEE